MAIWIPADRFLALLEQRRITNVDLGEGARKRVDELRTGRQECLSLEAADRILARLDLTYLFHLPKEAGGLADLYFEEDTYTPSWMVQRKAQLRAAPIYRKYHSEEERREANRLRTARSAAKRRTPCVDCGVPSSGERCRACHFRLVESPHGLVRYVGPHRCRCDVCRTAASAYHRDRRRRLKAAA